MSHAGMNIVMSAGLVRQERVQKHAIRERGFGLPVEDV